MQKTLAVVVMLVLVGSMASEASAGNSASQTITIRVMPIDVITIFPISPINLGQSGETDLKWTTNGDDRKVFVRIDHLPVGLKSFKVEALSQSFWGEHRQLPVSTGEVTLGTDQRELISAVGGSIGGCKIKYTAEAKAGAVESGTSEVIEVSYIFTTPNGSTLSVSSHLLMIGLRGPLDGLSIQKGVTFMTIIDIN